MQPHCGIVVVLCVYDKLKRVERVWVNTKGGSVPRVRKPNCLIKSLIVCTQTMTTMSYWRTATIVCAPNRDEDTETPELNGKYFEQCEVTDRGCCTVYCVHNDCHFYIRMTFKSHSISFYVSTRLWNILWNFVEWNIHHENFPLPERI